MQPGTTIAECQQQLLQHMKSGESALYSSDKEGYRTLCYYRQTFLFASVGDDGSSVLRLPTDEALLNYVWRESSGKLVLEDGLYQWSYDLTEVEKLERWQAIITRLAPFNIGQQQFVASVLQGFAGLPAN